MKRILVFSALVFAMTALSAQSALAARVYNFTPITLKIAGSDIRASRGQFALASGQRSESVHYPHWARITVEDPSIGVAVCSILANGELVGGNYMTIGNIGSRVHCVICNSSHQVMQSSAGNATHNWQGHSRTGC